MSNLAVFGQKRFPTHATEDPKEDTRYKGKAILLHLTYGAQKPGGDLKKRFGWNNALGGGLEFIGKNNLILGAEAHYIYGTKVLEDPLSIIRTDSGYIIGNDRSIATVVLRERGLYVGALIGKLFTFNTKRSGLRLTLSGGYLRHKIRIQDDTRSVTQVTGDYAKGYDRLTGGLSLNQFVGYQFMGRSRSVNYVIGFEINEGFTHSLRDWDFALRQKITGNRLDLRYGIRIGWTLPFFVSGASTIYY